MIFKVTKYRMYYIGKIRLQEFYLEANDESEVKEKVVNKYGKCNIFSKNHTPLVGQTYFVIKKQDSFYKELDHRKIEICCDYCGEIKVINQSRNFYKNRYGQFCSELCVQRAEREYVKKVGKVRFARNKSRSKSV